MPAAVICARRSWLILQCWTMRGFGRSSLAHRSSGSGGTGSCAMCFMRSAIPPIRRLRAAAQDLCEDPDPVVADAARWAVARLDNPA